MEKLNRWRWILLYSSLFFAIVASIFSNFADKETGIIITGITCFAISVALLVLLLIKPATVLPRFKMVLIILLGIGVFLWFVTYAKHPGGDFWRKCWWTFDSVGIILSISMVLLLHVIYMDKTIIQVPIFIAWIIVGLVLNRLGADAEGGYFTLLGFFIISTTCLREAIVSLRLYRKKIFQKRLFFTTSILLCICSVLFFLQFASYELSNFGVFDILQTAVFLVTILLLFIVMPFSNYTEWQKSTRLRFKRLILLPGIFIYILLAVRFILPSETYRKLIFKEHAGTEIHFNMKDYEIKDPE